jgi:hypothetical protein
MCRFTGREGDSKTLEGDSKALEGDSKALALALEDSGKTPGHIVSVSTF